MSGIAIYEAVRALSITVDGVTPQVYGITTAPRSMAAGNLPARVISVLNTAVEGGGLAMVTVGSNPHAVVSWQVSDLLLFKTANADTGARADDEPLIDYIDQYISRARSNRSLTSTSSITNLRAEASIYEYSGTAYRAVMVTLDIVERVG